MIKRDLLRGYNEKVFYAESSENAEKIFKLEMHTRDRDTAVTKEIFALPSASLAAF